MSSLIRHWTEGASQPTCPVVLVIVYDMCICLLTPLYFITAVMLVLTSKPAEDLFGGEGTGSGYHGTKEPPACARVTIIMMCNFILMCGTILMFYFKPATMCSFVSAMALSVWSGITLGEFFAYGCTGMRFPSVPPAIRLLTYVFLYCRLILQVIDCMWNLIVTPLELENSSNANLELIEEEAGGDRDALSARRMIRRQHRRASNTPAANLYHSGRLSSASGAPSPAAIQLSSALPPVFALESSMNPPPPPSAPVMSSAMRAVFADRSSSPLSSSSSTDQFSSSCVICLGDFAIIASVPVESTPLTPRRRADPHMRVFLHCCHSFHRACIDSWFRACMQNNKPQACPTCRHCPVH